MKPSFKLLKVKLNPREYLEMIMMQREFLIETLDYLSSFCNLFIYSHGLKPYILEILDVIDPNEKYFKERNKRLVAPENTQEQKSFNQSGKKISNFIDPTSK